MKVLVLLGADSPEREVSLRSGAAVSEALVEAGYEVSKYDPKKGYEGLRSAVQEVDVVLPILHGVNGEDGVVQKQLEDLGVPFLGSDSRVSGLCFDKNRTHEVLESVGVRMPKHSVVSLQDLQTHELFTEPFVLKPVEGGSSVDTLVARKVGQIEISKASQLLKKYKKMILEELIDGQEITVPVLGAEVLPVIAIIPPEKGEFDYENKYNGATKEIVPVPKELVNELVQKQAQELALRVHKSLGARHVSRTDMFVAKNGELVVLELNTIPGMTGQSLLPKSAKAAGYSMPELVTRFVDLTKRE